MMGKRTRRRMPLLAAGLAFVASGCSLEVINPGAIQDSDLNTVELMPIVVAGVSSEFSDIGDTYAFDIARLSDEMAGTGSYFQTGQARRGFQDWEQTQGEWEQGHEAAWAADEAWIRLQNVLGDAEANSSALAARTLVFMGLAHRWMGEMFCEMVYNAGAIQPRTAAFDSAIAAFDLAIAVGTAAGADAADFVTAAHGGKAQAYVGLGNWPMAVAEAALVPTDFEMVAHYNRNDNTNLVYDETHGRAEIGAWGSWALALGDPRTPITQCGEWAGTPGDPAGGVNDLNCTSGSGAHQGADGETAHYRQDKHDDWGSDVAIVSGDEMRLIEAEAAMLNGDWDEFLANINDARAFNGVADRTETAADLAAMGLGTLDWPYASPADDARSILDEERYLTLWLEGRRLYDLHRWDHPFLDGGTVAYESEPRRVSCYSVPESECQLNREIQGSSLMTGYAALTQPCSG